MSMGSNKTNIKDSLDYIYVRIRLIIYVVLFLFLVLLTVLTGRELLKVTYLLIVVGGAPLYILIIYETINIYKILRKPKEYRIFYPEFKDDYPKGKFSVFKLTIEISEDEKIEVVTDNLFNYHDETTKGYIKKYLNKKCKVAYNLATKRLIVFPVDDDNDN